LLSGNGFQKLTNLASKACEINVLVRE